MENKKTIIIVEDDVFLSDIYQTKFSDSGYSVVMAQDGKRCLDLLKSGTKADLILLDIVMPRMDGLEVLSIMKSDEELKNVPVVLLTNLGQETDIKKGMEMGAADYLIKAHYTPSEVVKKAEEILKKTSL